MNRSYGKALQKMRDFEGAVKQYNFIIEHVEKGKDWFRYTNLDIHEVGIEKYAYKAYLRMSQIYSEALWFATAMKYLEKSEELVKSMEMQGKDVQPSYRMLKYKRYLALYYKKFQKYERSLEVFMFIYKEQRRIYNTQNKKVEVVEPEPIPAPVEGKQ